MARHRHRPYHYGGGGGGGRGGRSWGEASGSSRVKSENDTIRCSHCDVSLPRYRFPKSVLVRYDKKIARADNPKTVQAICHHCCEAPNVAAPSAPVKAENRMVIQAAPPASLTPVRRGCCTECRIEYPLTRQYFTKVDIRIDAEDHRVCFTCRSKEAVFDDGYDVKQASGEEEAIHVEESDDEDANIVMPVARIEDQNEVVQQRARQAGRDYGYLVHKLLSARSLVSMRRMRGRFVPSRLLLEQQRRQAVRDQQNHIARMSAVDLTIRDASLARTRELLSDNENIHPDADFVYNLFDVWDLSMLIVKQDEEFRTALARTTCKMEDEVDELADEVDDTLDFHLTEEQRLARIVNNEELQLDREDALLDGSNPRDAISREQMERLLQPEAIRRYQEITTGGAAAVHPSPVDDGQPGNTSFHMSCLLGVLDEICSQNTSSSSSLPSSSSFGSTVLTSASEGVTGDAREHPAKRVRFAVAEPRPYW